MTFPERATLGPMQNPVRGLLNGTAALVASVGLGFLIAKGSGWSGRLSLAAFGAALMMLFTVSALYHTVPWRPSAKAIMRRIDHSAIFALIAATYTPLAIIVFDGWVGWTTLSVVWGIAAIGIGQHVFFPRPEQVLSMVLFLVMGWISLLLMVPMGRRLGLAPVMFYIAGGVLYTVGTIFMATGRPRMWPRIFSAHELFHVLVIAAGTLHYVATIAWVAPYAA